jgi:DNA-binding transcriptional LysR family regulator
MTFLRLRYFIAVAEELHFGRAAKRLMVTQPSLSRQITLLEEEIGVPLLVRDTRRVALTSAGREYLGQVREILRSVTNAAESARRAERGESGRLSVAFYYIAGLGILPPVLREFRLRHPNVSLELRELPSRWQIAEVLKGTIDVGIVHEPSTVKGVSVEPIQREAMVAVLPSTHALAKKPTLRLPDLQADTFIMFPRTDSSGLHDRIIASCNAAGFSPNVVNGAKMIVTVIGMVAARMGIAILPGVCAKIRHPDVVFRKILPAIEIQTGVIWNGHTEGQNPLTQSFIEVCRASSGAG